MGPDRDDGLGPEARALREANPYLSAVWQLVGGAVTGVLLGWVLDRFAGTGPWGVVGGSAAGIVVGFYAFLRTILRLDARRKGKGP